MTDRSDTDKFSPSSLSALARSLSLSLSECSFADSRELIVLVEAVMPCDVSGVYLRTRAAWWVKERGSANGGRDGAERLGERGVR